MTASVTVGRALRYADGSARGLLHHERGHGLYSTVAAAPELPYPEFCGRRSNFA